MNLRDLLRQASAVQRALEGAPEELRRMGDLAHSAADLVESGTALARGLSASPLGSVLGVAQAAAAPRPASAPRSHRAPSTRAPSTASFREPAPRREAPVPVSAAAGEVIDATFDETVIDPSKPAARRRR